MCAILRSLVSLQYAQARTFQQASGPSYSEHLVRLNLTSVQLDVYGIPLNLNKNVPSRDFSEDRRCVVFRVQFVG